MDVLNVYRICINNICRKSVCTLGRLFSRSHDAGGLRNIVNMMRGNSEPVGGGFVERQSSYPCLESSVAAWTRWWTELVNCFFIFIRFHTYLLIYPTLSTYPSINLPMNLLIYRNRSFHLLKTQLSHRGEEGVLSGSQWFSVVLLAKRKDPLRIRCGRFEKEWTEQRIIFLGGAFNG